MVLLQFTIIIYNAILIILIIATKETTMQKYPSGSPNWNAFLNSFTGTRRFCHASDTPIPKSVMSIAV
jgi:hypothetical protein